MWYAVLLQQAEDLLTDDLIMCVRVAIVAVQLKEAVDNEQAKSNEIQTKATFPLSSWLNLHGIP